MITKTVLTKRLPAKSLSAKLCLSGKLWPRQPARIPKAIEQFRLIYCRYPILGYLNSGSNTIATTSAK